MEPAAAHEPPFALDGSVNRDKVHELLGVETELTWLDYKVECDLNDTESLVEVAKDIGAMEAAAGYLLVGVDDTGKVVGLPPRQERLFDEATLRSKLDKYLGDGFEIRCAVQDVTDETDDTVQPGDASAAQKVAVVWVAQHPDGFNVFKRTGGYLDRKGKEQTAFLEGDVFVRHGTKSEKWNQADVDKARRAIVARSKDAWRAEQAGDVNAIIASSQAASAVTAGTSALYTWNLDASGFESASVELLRNNDDIPIRRMLRSAQEEMRSILATDGVEVDEAALIDDLDVILDRLISLAGLALELDRPAIVRLVCTAIAETYSWSVARTAINFTAVGLTPIFWLHIGERLYALGALAVRLQAWDVVRDLALLRVAELQRDTPGRTWHREVLTQSSRAGLFNVTKPDGRTYDVSLLMFARGVTARLPALRPDLPAPAEELGNSDPMLLSLCEFDLLVAIICSVANEVTTTREVGIVCWTNFARFDGTLDEPVAAMLNDPSTRRALVSDINDRDLARVLDLVNQVALQSETRFFGWEGYRTMTVQKFISQNKATT